jgi:shikimate kinase
MGAELTIEIKSNRRPDYQHVPFFRARLSGNGIAGGSIGGAEHGNFSSDTVRCVVLIGMMGAGKSTIGRRLSARLRMPFLDADVEIEAAAGMSIPDIFETHGEPDFRDGEARVIARLLDSGPAVVATGGGAFMREETRNRIRDKAVSIWLKADAEIIMRRVRRRADRPLLQTPDPAATVDRLLGEREPVYQNADITIWSRDVPHDKIVDECIEALHAKLCRGATASTRDQMGATS